MRCNDCGSKVDAIGFCENCLSFMDINLIMDMPVNMLQDLLNEIEKRPERRFLHDAVQPSGK